MAVIESKQVELNGSINHARAFLMDLSNIEQLLPDDRISSFEGSEESCAFTIKGLAGISMKRDEGASTDGNVKIVSHGKNPFDFELDIFLAESNGSTTAQMRFDGNMNFMIETMAKTPLTNLFNMMADRLAEKFS